MVMAHGAICPAMTPMGKKRRSLAPGRVAVDAAARAHAFDRKTLPGADQMGFLATSLLGIAGSVVGGLIGRLIRPPEEGAAFHPAGFFMSIVGAIILLWAFRSVQ